MRWTCVFLLAFLPISPALAEDLRLTDGDRVVLVGNTLIEREQRDGYWETALTSRFPASNVTFRNLGWSGDTVWGEAQAGFGGAADGFRHLQEHVTALKPTVIVVGYGSNESFAGPAGLPRFEQGLNTLLDMLTKTKARIVLLAPLRQEDMGRPLPDPTEANRNLALYRDTLKRAAEQRGYPFVDLYDLLGRESALHMTDNGIHLTAYGYWRSALAWGSMSAWRIEVRTDGTIEGRAARAARELRSPLRLNVIDETLPLPPLPADAPKGATRAGVRRVLRVHGLGEAPYTLRIDGKDVVTATTAEWDAGIELTHGPEFDQAEKLRQTIVAKNREYFHRWRPQNETYLFGFRKHEQGQNAREIPQFDPLIARLEAEIARLRVPVAHTYELVPAR